MTTFDQVSFILMPDSPPTAVLCIFLASSSLLILVLIRLPDGFKKYVFIFLLLDCCSFNILEHKSYLIQRFASVYILQFDGFS